jgi:hypothetical protein
VAWLGSISPKRIAPSVAAMKGLSLAREGRPVMTEFRYDHVHLRSPDPKRPPHGTPGRSGAEVIHSVMSNGSSAPTSG